MFTFYIAGVQHHDYHKVLKEMKIDDNLKMIPDPSNRFDPNAIQLVYPSFADPLAAGEQDVIIGWVPKKHSADVSAFLKTAADPICTIVDYTPEATPWNMIKVEIVDLGTLGD